MNAIELDIPPRYRLPYVVDGLLDLPGRNHPAIGRWLAESICPKWPRVIADPMCGGGQLWMSVLADEQRPTIHGCEVDASRARIALTHGIRARQDRAEQWTPLHTPDLVAFSPPYPNCDHSSGQTEHQQELVRSKGLQAMQEIGGGTNPPPRSEE